MMRNRAAQLLITALILAMCLFGVWNTGRAGLSRLFSAYGAGVDLLLPVDKAVELSPADPEAHFIRASMLSKRGQLAEAIQEYERAVVLRPDDYVLWLELAQARDQVDDEAGALAASRQAVRLAPFYGRTHWQLGNLLLRAGQLDEAFAEMRRAASSEPTHLPALIDLAWHIAQGDVQVVEQLVDPQTEEAHLALAQFFKKQRETAAALAQFNAAGSLAKQDRRAWLTELLAARQFQAAYQLWLSERNASGESVQPATGIMTDGGFEKEIALDEAGFGWRLAKSDSSLAFSLDANGPRAGAASLQIDFRGNPNPALPLISQLVIVEPQAHYRLRFAARTDGIVTGGLPQIVVIDASSSDQRVLKQSPALPQDTAAWQDYELDFVTGEMTSAVQIILQREKCTSGPCPIFGRLWLDSFAIQKL